MNLSLGPAPAPAPPDAVNWRAAIAPMMGYTDRHFRYFMRLLSSRVRLYTEMLTPGAILHGNRTSFLAYHAQEHPLALQLGGSDPQALAECARIAEDLGYDEVNLNAGCPSERVQQGRFGACLMAEPELVAQCVTAMRAAVRIPITLKTRIGIDNTDSYAFLKNFVMINQDAGCEVFIIHARKAWLNGLNPKQNREVPPLCYSRVTQLQQDFPQLTIILNGGITDIDAVPAHLENVKGVMIGRSAYQAPYQWHALDAICYGEDNPQKSRHELVLEYCDYMETQLHDGVPLRAMTRHLLPLFNGLPGANRWRRKLSEAMPEGVGVKWVIDALLAKSVGVVAS